MTVSKLLLLLLAVVILGEASFATESVPPYWELRQAYSQGRLVDARKMALDELERVQDAIEAHVATGRRAEFIPSAFGLMQIVVAGEGALKPGLRSVQLIRLCGQLLLDAKEIDGLIGLRAPHRVSEIHRLYQKEVGGLAVAWLKAANQAAMAKERAAVSGMFRDELAR